MLIIYYLVYNVNILYKKVLDCERSWALAISDCTISTATATPEVAAANREIKTALSLNHNLFWTTHIKVFVMLFNSHFCVLHFDLGNSSKFGAMLSISLILSNAEWNKCSLYFHLTPEDIQRIKTKAIKLMSQFVSYIYVCAPHETPNRCTKRNILPLAYHYQPTKKEGTN